MDRERRRRQQNAWRKAKRRGPRGGEIRETDRRYRARQAGVEVKDVPLNWEPQQLWRQQLRCHWCGELMPRLVRLGSQLRTGYEADHIVPLDEGGEHSPDNMVLSCIGCNARHGGQVNGGGRLEPASTDDTVL